MAIHNTPSTINLSLPQSWSHLNDRQLHYLYSLLANDYTSAQLRTLCLCRWSGLKILSQLDTATYRAKLGKQKFPISTRQIGDAIEQLKWLDTLPPNPVRIARIGRHTALPADFLAVPLESYIICDNLYQGFLHTKQETFLDDMARIMYNAPKISLDSAERISIFYWFASLKALFARLFPNFFQPTANTESTNLLGLSMPAGQQLKEAMNAQIRALTKGDITKEREVLNMDCYRALTELDAQAKEYNEINAKYGNK